MLKLPLQLLAAAALLALLTGPGRADLIITEIVDGTLPGGLPKWVELHNDGGSTVDVTLFEIARYNNGATSATSAAALTGGPLAAGGFYIVAYENASTNSTYSSVYGDTADVFLGPFINGDDAVAVRDVDSGTVLDVYGVIGEDGSGKAWEYTDGYSFRCTTGASAAFVPGDWTLAGTNSLETGDDSEELVLLRTLTEPRALNQCGTVSYCTAGTTASGCNATLSALGVPSASLSSGFTVTASFVEGDKFGTFFFGTSGRKASPWGSSSSYKCVVPPVARAGTLPGTGTSGACDGSTSQDLNALWCAACPKPTKNPGAGAVVQLQFWFRDPQNTSNQDTSLSDAIEFTVSP